MTTYHIKLIALVTMIIDHIGYFLVKDPELNIFFRTIGRLSAPLFWYCFAVGFKHTRSVPNYIKRLILAISITEIGNIIISLIKHKQYNLFDHNMFLTFLLSCGTLIAIINIQKKKNIIINIFLLIITIVLSLVVPGYKLLSLTTILFFYFIENKYIMYLLYLFNSILFCYMESNIIQLFMIFSLFIIMFDNHKKPEKSHKKLFYVAYPLHIWILQLLS